MDCGCEAFRVRDVVRARFFGKHHVVESMEEDADGGTDVRLLCGKVYRMGQISSVTKDPLVGLLTSNCQTCEALADASGGQEEEDD